MLTSVNLFGSVCIRLKWLEVHETERGYKGHKLGRGAPERRTRGVEKITSRGEEALE